VPSVWTARCVVTVGQAMDPRHQVLSAGGAVVPDVLALTLVPVVHSLPQAVRQGPCKLDPGQEEVQPTPLCAGVCVCVCVCAGGGTLAAELETPWVTLRMRPPTLPYLMSSDTPSVTSFTRPMGFPRKSTEPRI